MCLIVRLGIHRFVFGNQHFHNDPSYQVGHGAYTEYDEIAGRLSFKSHESHVGLSRIVEQSARTHIDAEGTDASGHAVDSYDGCYGALGEHVTNDGIQIGRP